MQAISTQFRDPGPLADGDLRLALRQCFPGDETLGLVPAYRFNMIHALSEHAMGHIELRLGDNEFLRMYAGQIAYGVAPQHRGRHYAGRSLKLVLPLAREHGYRELWITANPDNWPSRRTCEWAGAELVEIVPLPNDCEMYLRGERRKCRYRIRLSAESAT